MKDTIVTARRKKIELITLLVCFVVSNLIHLYAIIAYHAPFTEMITSIFYIIIFAFVLYAFLGGFYVSSFMGYGHCLLVHELNQYQ